MFLAPNALFDACILPYIRSSTDKFYDRGGKRFFRMHEEYLFRMYVRNTDEASSRN